MVTSEQYEKMARWSKEVTEYIKSLAEYFDKEEIEGALKLVENNEAAIGLSMLADIAVKNDIQLPVEAKQKIKDWCEGLEELPENF